MRDQQTPNRITIKKTTLTISQTVDIQKLGETLERIQKKSNNGGTITKMMLTSH